MDHSPSNTTLVAEQQASDGLMCRLNVFDRGGCCSTARERRCRNRNNCNGVGVRGR